MRCPKCDTAIYVKNGYCPSCGSPLEVEIILEDENQYDKKNFIKNIDGIYTLKGFYIIACIICIIVVFAQYLF